MESKRFLGRVTKQNERRKLSNSKEKMRYSNKRGID